jgi:hypothetical protein
MGRGCVRDLPGSPADRTTTGKRLQNSHRRCCGIYTLRLNIKRCAAGRTCDTEHMCELQGGMAMKVATRAKLVKRRDWSRQDERELKKHSKSKTSVKDISKALKRTAGALRQKARSLGLSLGHRRPKKKRA